MTTDEWITDMVEAQPSIDIFITGMSAAINPETSIVRLFGWTDMPTSFTPEGDQPIERFLVLRAVMTIAAFRNFIERSKHNLDRL